MVNYQLGKIYKIVNDENNKFYIGSTAQKYLSNRMNTHRQKHSRCMSKNIGVDLNECSIILIENYPCKDKPELRRKEREYFDKYKKECKEVFVNKQRPILYKGEQKKLDNERYEKNKELKRKQNKEWNKKNRKEYNDNNKEKMKEWYEKNKEKRKELYEKNKDKLKKIQKKCYEKNKEKINEKITCECGRTINKQNLSRHKKSKIHLTYLARSRIINFN